MVGRNLSFCSQNIQGKKQNKTILSHTRVLQTSRDHSLDLTSNISFSWCSISHSLKIFFKTPGSKSLYPPLGFILLGAQSEPTILFLSLQHKLLEVLIILCTHIFTYMSIIRPQICLWKSVLYSLRSSFQDNLHLLKFTHFKCAVWGLRQMNSHVYSHFFKI